MTAPESTDLHMNRRITDDIADISKELFDLVQSTSDPERRIGYLIQLKSLTLLGKNTEATIKATDAINRLVNEFSGHVEEDNALKNKGKGMIVAARVFWAILIAVGCFTQYLVVDKVSTHQQSVITLQDDVKGLSKKMDVYGSSLDLMLQAEMADERHAFVFKPHIQSQSK